MVDFLHNWDELRKAFFEADNSEEDPQKRQQFEDVRATLQYGYPKIESSAIVTRYAYADHIRGIMIRNYDVIGNFLLKSPFAGREWFRSGYARREFEEQWDTGRTILVQSIGFFDCYRQSTTHLLYWILHLVPKPKKKEKNQLSHVSEKH